MSPPVMGWYGAEGSAVGMWVVGISFVALFAGLLYLMGRDVEKISEGPVLGEFALREGV